MRRTPFDGYGWNTQAKLLKSQKSGQFPDESAKLKGTHKSGKNKIVFRGSYDPRDFKGFVLILKKKEKKHGSWDNCLRTGFFKRVEGKRNRWTG